MSKYVIVDLEMCNVPKGIKRDTYNWRNELIQIGAVVVDESLNIIDEFNFTPLFFLIDDFRTIIYHSTFQISKFSSVSFRARGSLHFP